MKKKEPLTFRDHAYAHFVRNLILVGLLLVTLSSPAPVSAQGQVGRWLAGHFGVYQDEPYIKTIGEPIPLDERWEAVFDQVLVEKQRMHFTFALIDSDPPQKAEENWAFLRIAGTWFLNGSPLQEEAHRSILFNQSLQGKVTHRLDKIAFPLPLDLKNENRLTFILDGITVERENKDQTFIGPWVFEFDVAPEEVLSDKFEFSLDQQYKLDDIYFKLDHLALSPINKELEVRAEILHIEDPEDASFAGGGWGGPCGEERGRLAAFKLIADNDSEYELFCTESNGAMGRFSDTGVLTYETKSNYYEKVKDSKSFRLIPYLAPEGADVLKNYSSLDELIPWEEQEVLLTVPTEEAEIIK